MTGNHMIIIILLVGLIELALAKPVTRNQQEEQESQDSFEARSQASNNNNNLDKLQILLPSTMNSNEDQSQLNPYMQVHKLSPTSNNITCNDGSRVGYYKRLNSHSKSWIIYLQGGGFCNSEESCQRRWQLNPNLMSSNNWPESTSVDGILSSEPNDNPYLWNANHIYIPYCSSDSWSGLSRSESRSSAGSSSQRHRTSRSEDDTSNRSFHFMGSKIIERVLDSLYDDLPLESSLYGAKFILLAGDSAGATGVILNLDRVSDMVQRRIRSASKSCQSSLMLNGQIIGCEPSQPPVIRGIADSGWFLDNEPYDYGLEIDQSFGSNQASDNGAASQQVADLSRQLFTPLESIRQAQIFWNGQVPEACEDRYPAEPWRCYFGYRAYQTLKTPLFVVQWLYDEAQLIADNVPRPDSVSQWNYVLKVVDQMRASLENVTALFAPSCFSHSLITRKAWNQININGLKLPHVLNSWEEQLFRSLWYEVYGGPSVSMRRRDAERFRLIDSCGQAQCNRDCPPIDLEFGPLVPF